MNKETCSICGYKSHFDFADGVKKHIVQVARYEVWQQAIGSIAKTPHFDYYMKNTEARKLTTRSWKI